MLAVKMHKRRRPWLGVGSFVVPVISWATAKRQISYWSYELTRGKGAKNPSWTNDQINYLTLVRIPDAHPVKLYRCWSERVFDPQHEFIALRDLDPSLRHEIGAWDDMHGPACSCPELILGMALPRSALIWTKDIRLLYKTRKRASPRTLAP